MRTRLPVLLAVLVLTVVACGGDPDPFGAGTGTSTPGTTTPGGTSTTTESDATTTSAGAPTTTEPSGDTTTTVLPPSLLMDQIAASGVLRVGVYDLPLLPLIDPAAETGFEADLAREIATRLFPGATVEFTPLTAAQRFGALQDGTIDILIRGTSHTTAREELVAFSAPYLLDGMVVVVLADSGWRDVEDLAGAALAVRAGTTTQIAAEDHFHAAGVAADIEPVDDPFVQFAAGGVDGFIDSWIFALTAQHADPDLRIIWLEPTDPIAAALPLGDPGYSGAVTATIRSIVDDGTWAELAETWFPGRLPFTKREMLRRPPTDR